MEVIAKVTNENLELFRELFSDRFDQDLEVEQGDFRSTVSFMANSQEEADEFEQLSTYVEKN